MMQDIRRMVGNHRQTTSKVSRHKKTKEKTPQKEQILAIPIVMSLFMAFKVVTWYYFVEGFFHKKNELNESSTARARL